MNASNYFLYRAFDGADRLLYIGQTNDVETRMKSHHATAPWSVYMAHFTTEGFDSRKEVEAAEARAIQEEHPRWNLNGRSADHPDGFATSARQAEWLRPEREVAENVRHLRSQVAQARKKLRGLLIDLQMEESIVSAISNGTLDQTIDSDDAGLLGESA